MRLQGLHFPSFKTNKAPFQQPELTECYPGILKQLLSIEEGFVNTIVLQQYSTADTCKISLVLYFIISTDLTHP